MSIEALLLRHLELSTKCAPAFTLKVPDSCNGLVHLFGFVAQFHLITWMVIGFFFIMLFSIASMVFSGHGGGH